LHVLSTKIKFRVSIPLHERCPNLARFLRKKWLPIMKVYQKTDTPYILCSILNEPSKRKQMSPDAVQALNKRAMEAAGLDGSTNYSRHCDAKRSRTGPSRPEESAHNAHQDNLYRDCTAAEPDFDAGSVELPSDDESNGEIDFDQFRCPANGTASA
jgi:hypothetical protein